MPLILNLRKHSSNQNDTNIQLVKKEPQKQTIIKQTHVEVIDINTENQNTANDQNQKQGISLVYKNDFVKPAENSAITMVKKDQTKPMTILKLINLDEPSIKEEDVNVDESSDSLANHFSNSNDEDLNILSEISSNIFENDVSVSAEYIELKPTLSTSESMPKEVGNSDISTTKHIGTKPNVIAFAFASDYLSKKNNQESNQIQLVRKGKQDTQTGIEQNTQPEINQVNQIEEIVIPKKSSEILYEEVEYNKLPILSEVKNQNSSNINYITIPTTASLFAVGSFKLSHNIKTNLVNSLASQLNDRLKNLPLSNSLAQEYGFELLGKSQEQVLAMNIAKVGAARAPHIVNAANEFIQITANSYSSVVIKSMMSINPIIDTASILIEPDLNKAGTLLVDISYLLSGSNIYSTSLSIAQSASLFYQGEYKQATQQTISSATYTLLPYIMQNNAIAIKITEFMISTYPVAPVIIALASTASIYKFYHILENFNSDQGNINSMISYKKLFQGLSEIVPKSLYDFTTKAIDLELSINKVKSNIEVENAEKYLIETRGIFGQKLHEHIYKKIIIEKYEILNKILSGKITQEEADNLKTNHVIIKQENMADYQCIEFKNLASKHNNDTEYYCHNDKVIDNVLIGENNIIKDIITIYSVD